MSNIYLVTPSKTKWSVTLDQLNDIKNVDLIVIVEWTPYFKLIKSNIPVFCLEDHLSLANNKDGLILANIIINDVKTSGLIQFDRIKFILNSFDYHDRVPFKIQDKIITKDNTFPSNIIETYAYCVGATPYIFKRDNIYVISHENKISTRLYLSKGIFNRSFKVDYNYTDKLLDIIDDIKEFRFLLPYKD